MFATTGEISLISEIETAMRGPFNGPFSIQVARSAGRPRRLLSGPRSGTRPGTVGAEARRYANKVMRDSNLAIIMLDGQDLNRFTANPANIVDAFNREAQAAMRLKTLDLDQ